MSTDQPKEEPTGNASDDAQSCAGSSAEELKQEADKLERTADQLAEDGLYSEAMKYRYRASQMRSKASAKSSG